MLERRVARPSAKKAELERERERKISKKHVLANPENPARDNSDGPPIS